MSNLFHNPNPNWDQQFQWVWSSNASQEVNVPPTAKLYGSWIEEAEIEAPASAPAGSLPVFQTPQNNPFRLAPAKPPQTPLTNLFPTVVPGSGHKACA